MKKKKIETPTIEEQATEKVRMYFKDAENMTRSAEAQATLAAAMVQYEIHLQNKTAKHSSD